MFCFLSILPTQTLSFKNNITWPLPMLLMDNIHNSYSYCTRGLCRLNVNIIVLFWATCWKFTKWILIGWMVNMILWVSVYSIRLRHVPLCVATGSFGRWQFNDTFQLFLTLSSQLQSKTFFFFMFVVSKREKQKSKGGRQPFKPPVCALYDHLHCVLMLLSCLLLERFHLLSCR